MNPSLDLLTGNAANEEMLAHMSKPEIAELSRAQGSFERDPDLNMPTFSKLGEMIKNKEFADSLALGFKGYLNAEKEDRVKLSQGLDELADETLGDETNYLPPDAFENEYPSAQVEGEMGENGDTELVIMPVNLFQFLWKNTPDSMHKINKRTGHPEFSLWENILGVIGGIGGFFVGGPVGAAIGAGLGSRGGALYDDSSLPSEQRRGFMEHLGGGLMYGAGAYGLGAAGAALGSGAGLGAAANAAAIPALISGGGATIEDSARQHREKALQAENTSKQEEAYKNERSSSINEYNNYLERMHNSSLDREDQILKRHRGRMQPKVDFWNKDDLDYHEKLAALGPRRAFKTGGEVVRHLQPITHSQLIQGDEGGQADNVYVAVPVGSRILDADIVAATGDGNTQAGVKKILEYIEKLPELEDTENDEDDHENGMANTALSAGEMVIVNTDVKRLGKGDLRVGHKKLDQFVKEVRAHKKHSVNTIPDATKHLNYYLKNKKRA